MSEELPNATEVIAPKKSEGSLLPLLLDFGPLLIFFAVFKLTQSDGAALASTRAAINGTLAFMAAILVAVAVSKWKLGRVSPMLWLSAVLVVGFGALTVYFNDESFIQIKPTIIYTAFAVLLLGGWMTGRPLLRYLLQAAYDGLNETGWMKLSRNWGLFFAGMALINEALRYSLDFETWLTVKVWGVTALSFLFAMSQIPMLMKHGLAIEGAKGE
ncbi:inner membrane-spanning protein YciB [Blastomonas fulva]|jgi:intracellular septation protein|uniref:inner membrane-spanning protein YciB n=1 Tax=Blastomonas fulva TaxID=1550728 RepID=UPI0025A41187|nr:inner membrane-spanning protein YciB [Blastomonas fulva]MDM7929052.1 inner membrane-spanning protein YciB [Blastomonas fulva]MDM7967310.1 inner membrane-spanning protein YciB [Blastomonas fulva]